MKTMTGKVEWIYFETYEQSKGLPSIYNWDINQEIFITVYGTLRTDLTQYVVIYQTGPIDDPVPTHKQKTSIPIETKLSRCEFPEVGCFKVVIPINKKEWPYDGKYNLLASYGGIKAIPIVFYISSQD